MDNRESSRFSAPLSQRVALGASSAQIADAVRASWADIDRALRPVVGRRGVEALFKRTLHLAASRHPRLAELKTAGDSDAVDLDHLSALLAAQTPALAAEAGDTVFEIFCELLTSLIGARLGERLLQTAWSTPSSAAAAQDPKP